jgi:outer membrane protein assembly factor BamB
MKMKPDNYVPNQIDEQNIGLSEKDGGLMNSSWPMYCHDSKHTGRSPYNTSNNLGVEIWNYETYGPAESGPSIDKDGTIYIGGYYLYAIYPNGTLKWAYPTIFSIVSTPAIDENGVIYFGTIYGEPSYLYALYPNGTLKWKWSGGSVFGSPVIGDDGTIYFGGDNHCINALYPNGTLKWKYQTGHVVYSSPAVSQDGTIYCGSHDTYLYALYSNNGTLKWRFKTGDWIRVSPCIADDGTIYCVSLDNFLYAIYPNGTMKWKTNVGAGTSPTIGQNGVIYAGYTHLYAINQINGSIQWVFDPGPGRTIEGGTPCNSADGTIYFGTSNGGEIVAVNSNGFEKWRKNIGPSVNSPPAIGKEGSIYVGSDWTIVDSYLLVFGIGPLRVEANGPYNGFAYNSLQFYGSIYGGIPPYQHHWDFGDGQTSNEQNPTYNYTATGNYTATFTVTDSQGNSSNDTAPVTIAYAPPSVSITKPDNSLYILNIRTIPFPYPLIIGPITIKVNATQEPLGIDRAEFFIDGKLKATDNIVPYEWTWWTPSFSKHTITIIAYDTSGKSASKSLIVRKLL